MGVYDTVKWRGETYQTKGLSRQMFQYEIVNERLYVKMPTRMPYDGPPLFDENTIEGLAAVNYHGLLEIHYPSIVIWFSDGRVRKVYHLVEEVERSKTPTPTSPHS